MAEISISITGDPRATIQSAFDLIGSNNTMTSNEPKEIVPGVTLTLVPMQERRSGRTLDAAPVMQFVLSMAGSIGLNIVSSYLYDKLKGRKDKIRLEINRRITEVDEGNISRIIEEEIKYSRN